MPKSVTGFVKKIDHLIHGDPYTTALPLHDRVTIALPCADSLGMIIIIVHYM